MSGQLKWSKSSYSDDEGDNCVEVATCTAPGAPITLHVRDSKDPASPELTVSAPAWTTFIAAVQPGA
ncbi:DUF397 domain-containing protein [Streptomyces sp. NPDC058284]|uniref:DUF397 domain-containing protein n=1 Tax=unclassified Streptomyces TaxID=2593676 RepID=UPI003668ABCC